MKIINDLLSTYFTDIDKTINNGVIGINYLETIKFLLIEKLETTEQKVFDDFQKKILDQKETEIKQEFSQRKISFTISCAKESTSKIKSEAKEDVLIIVLNGFCNFTIYDKNDKNKLVDLKIFKFMGLVLSEKTTISETYTKESIVLKIVNI